MNNNGIGEKLPIVQIPNDGAIIYGEYWPSFSVAAPDGELVVDITPSGLWCSGTQLALEGLGLLRPEWLPGAPGNGKTRNTIGLRDGRLQRVVKQRSRSICKEALTIVRVSRSKLQVNVPFSPGQKDQAEKILTKYGQAEEVSRAEAERRREVERLENEHAEFYSDLEAWRVHTVESECTFLNSIGTAISGDMEYRRYGKRTFVLDAESIARVNSAVAELKAALRSGRAIRIGAEKTRYPTEGNVIFLRRSAESVAASESY